MGGCSSLSLPCCPVRASLRLMVKRILRKYKYPPVKTEEVVELVLSQAEKLCEEWA
jgi:type I restriction enzyme R subunit